MSRWQYEDLFAQRAAAVEPSEADVAAVRRRVRESVGARAAPRRSLAALGLALAGAAALAAVVFAVSSSPADPVAEVALRSVGEWSDAAPRAGVELRFQGDGELVSAERIDWAEGVIEVDVEPQRGIELAVVTEEAEVRVVGTHFTVDRDSFGTRVDVDHGKVAVACADGRELMITGGESARCLRSAASGLGWAMALGEAGSGPEVRLAAVELSLMQPGGSSAVVDELSALRAVLLEEAGRGEDARVAAQAVLARVERTDMREIAARQALASGSCEAATPHLSALLSVEPITARLHLADCAASSDPQAARALLEEALAQALAAGIEADLVEAIEARLERLDG